MAFHDRKRREILIRIAAAGCALAGATVAAPAHARRNATLRNELGYRDTPNGGRQCSGCVQFLPGASQYVSGHCKAIRDDDEISPRGWCAAYITVNH